VISADAVGRPFNRGDYVVGAPTPPRFARRHEPGPGPAFLQGPTVEVPPAVVERLRRVSGDVATARDEVVRSTRDWWAATMIGETEGRPATPDAVVVRVRSAEQVRDVVRICAEAAIPITPSAGRSNVTGAALPVFGGVVLDVCGLDRIRHVDATAQVVDVEAGVFGDVLEKALQSLHGLTTGHWPSSYALSTVGGWIACRGAGQLSTRYGKIEDLVVGLDVVLPDGRLVELGGHPRAAIGPDLRQLLVGSEGTLGVITAARLRLHRLPDHCASLAYGFESFDAGLEACRQILQRGATPAVVRLYDKLESGVQFARGDCNVLLVADEGEQRLVDATLAVSSSACAELGTALDGEAVMARWLDSRFLVGKSAEGFESGPGFVSDTCEIAASWSALPRIYADVVTAIEAVPGTLAASAHQSHAYADGACLYFSLRGDVEPTARAAWYRAAWAAANGALIEHRAAISHHHGVGLLRGGYLGDSLGAGFSVLGALKGALDPKGIMNPGKLGLPSPFGIPPW